METIITTLMVIVVGAWVGAIIVFPLWFVGKHLLEVLYSMYEVWNDQADHDFADAKKALMKERRK